MIYVNSPAIIAPDKSDRRMLLPAVTFLHPSNLTPYCMR
jgi:hypothetical protein